METTWTEIETAIGASSLDRGLLERLLDALRDEALATLTNGTARDLERFASGAAAKTLKTYRAVVAESTGTLRAWYAGQLEMVVMLVRAMLQRQLPHDTDVMLRTYSNARRILTALQYGDADATSSTLAKQLGMDLGQFGKELNRLEGHGLVTTIKQGTSRWIRLSPMGQRAAAANDDVIHEISTSAERLEDAVKSIADLAEFMERTNNALRQAVAMKEQINKLPTDEYERLARQLSVATTQRELTNR